MVKREKIGEILLIFGLGLLVVVGGIKIFHQPQIEFSSFKPVAVDVVKVIPSRLIIESVNLNLPVFTAEISNGEWPLFDEGISYLLKSGEVGELGTAVFYGHNRTHLLGRLKEVKLGDLIIIRDDQNKNWVYQVSDLRMVNDWEVQALVGAEKAFLVVYTCAGLFDQKRLVVRANLVEK